jgi:hypothetical protein
MRRAGRFAAILLLLTGCARGPIQPPRLVFQLEFRPTYAPAPPLPAWPSPVVSVYDDGSFVRRARHRDAEGVPVTVVQQCVTDTTVARDTIWRTQTLLQGNAGVGSASELMMNGQIVIDAPWLVLRFRGPGSAFITETFFPRTFDGTRAFSAAAELWETLPCDPATPYSGVSGVVHVASASESDCARGRAKRVHGALPWAMESAVDLRLLDGAAWSQLWGTVGEFERPFCLEAAGQTWQGVLSAVHPGDRDRVAAQIARARDGRTVGGRVAGSAP